MMFEALMRRVSDLAEERARARAATLRQEIAEALPGGVRAEAVTSGVRLSGRGLVRRFATEPGLRWIGRS